MVTWEKTQFGDAYINQESSALSKAYACVISDTNASKKCCSLPNFDPLSRKPQPHVPLDFCVAFFATLHQKRYIYESQNIASECFTKLDIW